MGSGASAWWRSTNLDGIRDVVFEWHQKILRHYAGAQSCLKRKRDLFVSTWHQYHRTGVLDCALSRSELGQAQVNHPAERGGIVRFARTICAHDLFARFVRVTCRPQALCHTWRYIGDGQLADRSASR